MAPRYHIARDLVGADGLQSTSPHWVLGFARYDIPITYNPTTRKSISDDIGVAYQERPVLVVDDQGDCISVTVSAARSSHTPTMQLSFVDSGVKYLNEILPGDWVVACIVYSLNEAQRISQAMKKPAKINNWESGMKFLGRVQDIRKTVVVNDNGTPQSVYSVSCSAFTELDATIMYYPQLIKSESIPVAMERFAKIVGDIIRGNESNVVGALDGNEVVPKIIQALFGVGAWAGSKFIDGEALTPNESYIVPRTVMAWLGIDKARGTFADLLRVLVGIQKYYGSEHADNISGEASEASLFWPDGARLNDGVYRCSLPVVGAFALAVVPQTNTTPWAFLSQYFGQPLNEVVVSLRTDMNGDVYPFLTLRQTPYTSEVGRLFDNREYQIEIQQEQGTHRGATNTPPVEAARAPTMVRRPTTRYLELPRWVVSNDLIKESSIGRSNMMRQNLVFVSGSGPGAAISEADQFVNAKPVTDKIDILRHGIRAYMPSVACFTRDAKLLPNDWRDIVSDFTMSQHLTLNGTLTMSGVRAPIAPGDNLESEGIVYGIENLTHTCSISPDGRRSFITRLALSRGILDREADTVANPFRSSSVYDKDRAKSFPNVTSCDPEGVAVGVTKG